MAEEATRLIITNVPQSSLNLESRSLTLTCVEGASSRLIEIQLSGLALDATNASLMLYLKRFGEFVDHEQVVLPGQSKH
jgi:hypothetical protein